MRRGFVVGGATILVCVSLGLMSMQTGTLVNREKLDMDPAAALISARRAKPSRELEARWAMRHSARAAGSVEQAPTTATAEGSTAAAALAAAATQVEPPASPAA